MGRTYASHRRRAKRATTKRMKSVKKIVKNTIMGMAERHNATFTTSQSCVYNSGILDITDNLMPQGLGDEARIGDEVTPTSFTIGSTITWTSSTAALSPVRLLIIQQNKDADDTLAYTTILATTAQGYTTQSPFLDDVRPLFNVLYDRVHNPPSSAGGTRTTAKYFKLICKKPKKIKFNVGSATQTVDGKIAMYFFSNNGAGVDAPVYTGSARMNWKDF